MQKRQGLFVPAVNICLQKPSVSAFDLVADSAFVLCQECLLALFTVHVINGSGLEGFGSILNVDLSIG